MKYYDLYSFNITKTGLYTVLFGLVVFSAFPLFWMVSVSLMPLGESSSFPPPLLPSTPTFEHYVTLFTHMNMGRYWWNSFFLSLSVTSISLLINSMAGYAFAKFDFPGRDPIFKSVVSALIIPAQVAILPLFLLLKYFGLVNTYAGVILPGAVSVFGIFLIRQYASSLPDSLFEAARVDGASEFRIYWFILLPLIRPILVTLAIFTFMGTWNDFLWPLIMLSSEEMYTLPVGLATMSNEHAQDNELVMAGAVLTILPVLLLFLMLQKHYIQGIMLGSTKG